MAGDSASETRNEIAFEDVPISRDCAGTGEMTGAVLRADTVRSKLVDVVFVPLLTLSAIVALPVTPAAGVIEIVR